MQRQSSILSFFQKPPPENQKPVGNSICDTPGDEIRGTDTPPEKLPRRIFPDKFRSGEGPSPFSSIMHKFNKVQGGAISSTRNQANGGSVNASTPASDLSKLEALFTKEASHVQLGKCGFIKSNGTNSEGVKGFPFLTEYGDSLKQPVKSNFFESNGTDSKGVKGFPFLAEDGDSQKQPVKSKFFQSNGINSQGAKEFPFLIEEDDNNIHGPETPGMRPLVPRLKRVQEESCSLKGMPSFSLLGSSKRIKLNDPKVGEKNQHDVSDKGSKFEWLDPSRIRDADGRRPGDPLYDKRTLYIPPDVLKKMTASQKQYWTAKSQYMDVVLFFKVGKFYELYELDAEIGHRELDWKMTMSGVGKCRQVGISESGIDDAVQKLIARGYKVGRMEQLETSEQAKARGATAVIERKLVHVLTPATSVDGNIGPDSVHLLAIKEGTSELGNGSTTFGFAFVDCAALRLWVGSLTDDSSFAALGALLMQVSPKEVIYDSREISRATEKALKKYTFTGSSSAQLTPEANDLCRAGEVKNLIQSKGYFKGSCKMWDQTLDGVTHHDLALCALGGLVSHLSRLKLDDVLCNGDILPYQVYTGCLRMDGQTMVNLEIFNNNVDGGLSGTLYNYLNSCITSSGKRLLKKWICHPLTDIEKINRRLDVVEELMSHSELMGIFAQYLRKLPDLERLLGRVKASFQSSASLVLPLIGRKVLKQRVKVFGSLIKGLRVGIDLLILLQKEHAISSLSSILKLPVLSGSDGLHKFLLQFEAAVDSDFPKYQDHDVNDSDDETLSILIDLFIERVGEWSQVTQAIDRVDVLRSFAVIASSSFGAMSRPVILPLSNSANLGQVNRGPVFKVKGLRHPYALGESGDIPVPNDIYLGEDTNIYHPRTLLLTGPNMGGKSTLLRSTCLAVVLAQLGSYVPCEACVLSLVDTIFTRLGATDRIMTGESTFFIECTETASVLQNATQDSLVILDELGRGTSTFDGYAIAYAVFRHLVEKVNCRLLFATHYHPLTKEFASHPHVILRHMACAFESNPDKTSEKLVFLYRLADGACPESYGMQVALMAGIPKPVVEAAYRAGEVMKEWIGDSFKSSERRSEFSTLHEGWLKTLLSVSNMEECDLDAFDSLFCLWHELKSSIQAGK